MKKEKLTENPEFIEKYLEGEKSFKYTLICSALGGMIGLGIASLSAAVTFPILFLILEEFPQYLYPILVVIGVTGTVAGIGKGARYANSDLLPLLLYILPMALGAGILAWMAPPLLESIFPQLVHSQSMVYFLLNIIVGMVCGLVGACVGLSVIWDMKFARKLREKKEKREEEGP